MDQEKHQQQPHQQPHDEGRGGGGGGGGEAEKPSNVSLPAMFLPVQGVPWWGPGFNPGGSVRPYAVMPSQPVPQQDINDETQPQTTPVVLQSAVSEYVLPHAQTEHGQSMVPAAYQYVDPYYGGIITAYGAQPMFHPHSVGAPHSRMPLPYVVTEEEPVYVNAKQYKRIMMRRQCRAKAESENKLAKSRKPYLHESRHLHAIRRARGCGGRFLNKGENLNGNSDSSRSEEQQSSQDATATADSEKLDQGFNVCALQLVSGIIDGSSVQSVTNNTSSYSPNKQGCSSMKRQK